MLELCDFVVFVDLLVVLVVCLVLIVFVCHCARFLFVFLLIP